MDITKLTPATKDYIWGGDRLKTKYGIGDTARVAEGWMLSFHPDGECRTEDGTPISQAATRKDWGRACDGFPFFPTLVKLIDAADNLSVQVHPSDTYALQNENSYGKTETWYIVDAQEGAGIYLGFRRDVSEQELRAAIEAGTLCDLLNFQPVKKGECYFIEAGTVHAIGKGCLIAEVQQNSNLTYRVFDFNRVGADGKPRALHVEKALAVSRRTAFSPVTFEGDVLAKCPYFTVTKKCGDFSGRNEDSYTSLLVLDGEGTLCGKTVRVGESWFVPAGIAYEVKGNATVLVTVTEGK